jgi:hypothetical protein
MAKSSPLSGRIGTRFGGRGARKRTRIFAGFITLIAVSYFGTTFAASISLGNSNNPIEFGQGSRAAVACDSTGITTAIEETWNNATSYFKVNTVTLSAINNAETVAATGIGCRGKTIKLRVMGSSGPLAIGTSTATVISFVMPAADGALADNKVTGALGASVVASDFDSADAAQIVVTIPSTVDASTVTRIALETE